MSYMSLTKKKCVPCECGVPPLTNGEAKKLLKEIPRWFLEDKKIKRIFKFKNFVEAMKFVNNVAELSEQEGHHPDIGIQYNKVTLALWTHSIEGLSENDFILASKIEPLIEK